jgi:hypothetical protein
VKNLIISLSFLLFGALQEDLQNNPPETKQFIAVFGVLLGIAFMG